MAPNMNGKWKLIKSENFEEFMKIMGVNVLVRKMAGAASPTCEIIQDGDHFVIKNITTFWTSDVTFTVGEEREWEQDKVKMKFSSCWEGDKLVVNKVPLPGHKQPPQKVVRQIVGEELINTIYCKDIICTRTFKKMT